MATPRPSKVDQSASADGRDKPTTTTASPPFDDPKADLIIRSSDDTLFYVHRSLLSIISPVFKDMFELSNSTSQELYDNRLCLPVADDSRHLFCLLSWCDPRCNRPSPSLDNLEMTMSIADKYCMDSIFARAQKDLLAHDFSESESLRVFAIAILFRLDKLAQKAARATLGVPLAWCNIEPLTHGSEIGPKNPDRITKFWTKKKNFLKRNSVKRSNPLSDSVGTFLESGQKVENGGPYVRGPCNIPPQLKHITAFALQNLHNYHYKCKKAVRDLLASDSWDQAMEAATQHLMKEHFQYTHRVDYFSLKKEVVTKDIVLWTPTGYTAPWWSNYVDLTMDNLNECPGSFKIPVSEIQRLKRLISLDECNLCKQNGYEKLEVISLFLSKEIDEAISKVSFKVEY